MAGGMGMPRMLRGREIWFQRVRLSGAGFDGFHGGNVEEGDDFEFGGDAFGAFVDADEDAGARQQCHFGVADLVLLAAGEGQAHRLEGAAGEHFL